MAATTALVALVAMIALGTACLCFFLRSPWLPEQLSQSRRLNTWSAFGVVISATIIWSVLVNSIVEDAYMDEIFHIPQAQRYCHGKIFEWDDKLTTPPGLYLVPLATAFPFSQIFGFPPLVLCNPMVLRLQNAVCICLLFWVALHCRRKIERRLHGEHARVEPLDFVSQYSVHTALNISLFPVLFFFSGLYYTDVMSTLLVLVAFSNTLDRLDQKKSSFLNGVWTVFLGTATLLMRQTNIFWIVVFFGSIEAIHSLKMLPPTVPESVPCPQDEWAAIKHWAETYAGGDLWDAHVDQAGPFDLIHCVLSIAVAAVCHPLTVFLQIWPYIITLVLFVGFVIWNGGVVLGDKSNHVATIHLPQMLYIWPMFAFFMLPLAIPTLLELAKWAMRASRPYQPKNDDDHSRVTKKTQDGMARSPFVLYRLASPLVAVPSWFWLGLRISLACCVAAAVVHFNTIIHPFTLADNRHYMFYIFRYTIRRSELIRLALAPVYAVCAWVCWTILSPCGDFIGDRVKVRGQSECTEWRIADAAHTRGDGHRRPVGRTVCPDPDDMAAVRFRDTNVRHLHQTDHPAVETVLSSTVLALGVATTLSLMTAPLVEPRYFILPWVFFRLLCPAWRAHDHKYRAPSFKLSDSRLLGLFVAIGRRLDVRLVLETFWYILINLATMFVFLYCPFYWKDSEGALVDLGRLQRFIW